MIKIPDKLIKKIRTGIIPPFTILLFILISVLPYKSNNISLLMPSFPLVAIYLFSLYNPRNISYFSMFILGLLKDILDNGIIGLNSICFLIFCSLVKSNRKYIISHDFKVKWFGFMLFSAINVIVSLLLIKLNSEINLYSFGAIISQWLITNMVYVPIYFLLKKIIIQNYQSQ